MKRKICSLLLAAILLTPIIFLNSAFASAPPLTELSFAYIQADAAYMTVGEKITWQIMLPSNSSSYTFEYTLYHHPDKTASEEFRAISFAPAQKGRDSFSFKPLITGKYFLKADVSDETSHLLKLESEPFFSYANEDRENPSTLPGKLKVLAQECLAQPLQSDEQRAMWLHDWIIYHADYDESLTVYHPEGVLLNGSGVCESYVLAYHMLLKEVGINSIFVAGSSRAQNHAWTLVQFDQEWCHIDPTWNDPIGINAENHDYFGLNDFLMNRDHDWLESDTIFPRSESLAFNYNLRNDYLPFKDTEELKELISTSLSARQTPIKCSYLGPDANFDLSGGIKKWMTEYSPINLVESSSYRSSNFNGQIEVKYRSVEGYHDCRNENEFSQIMDELLTAHEPLIKIYYSGNDLDFDLYRVMENWLPANYARYRVTGYNCSSSQFSLDMTVTYGE